VILQIDFLITIQRRIINHVICSFGGAIPFILLPAQPKPVIEMCSVTILKKLNMFILVGLPSPSGRSQKPAEDLQRNQTIGQKIMGNMMDNLFIRSFTSKSKARVSDASAPSSPIKVLFSFFPIDC
jgi:hypothetical protein